MYNQTEGGASLKQIMFFLNHRTETGNLKCLRLDVWTASFINPLKLALNYWFSRTPLTFSWHTPVFYLDFFSPGIFFMKLYIDTPVNSGGCLDSNRLLPSEGPFTFLCCLCLCFSPWFVGLFYLKTSDGIFWEDGRKGNVVNSL